MSDMNNNFIEIGLDEKSVQGYTTKKLIQKSVLVKPNDEGEYIPPSSGRDGFILKNDFITPSEYYSNKVKISSTDGTKEGYMVVHANSNANVSDDDITWFWCDDIKNWCTYKVIIGGPSDNIVYLYVWNGKNGWISLANITIENDTYSKSQDYYGIRKYQEPILEKIIARNDLLNMTRSWCQYLDGNGLTDIGPMQVIHGIRLYNYDKYTINDTNDFQTVRWQTVPGETGNGEIENYAQSNIRQGITTGIPCVYRLPSNEIMLATTIMYRGDSGLGYHFVSDGNGFRKEYNSLVDGTGNISVNGMLGTDPAAAERWINSVCAKFFGTGNDKTIEDDWLNDFVAPSDMNSYIRANYTDMLDSSKTFEQTNINKANDLKCGFTLNRPVITTVDREEPDYAEKW